MAVPRHPQFIIESTFKLSRDSSSPSIPLHNFQFSLPHRPQHSSHMMASSTISPYLLAQINSSHPDAPHVATNYRAASRLVRSLEATEDPVLARFAAAAASSISVNQQVARNDADKSPEDEKPIPIASKVLHKFYEPVILLVSLIDAVGPNSSSSSTVSEPSSTVQETDFQVFKAFVNKLSHVCSSSKGGETVTSFVILRDSPTPDSRNGRVHYWFAMNNQSQEKLVETQTYVESLLRKIGRAPPIHGDAEGWEATKREIFRDLLVFNRPRITSYLRMIRERARKCVEVLGKEETNENQLLAASIAGIICPSSFGESIGGPEADYLEKIQTTIRELLRLERSKSYSDLLKLASEGRCMSGSSKECFSDLVHTAKRILAYPQSVQYILTKARPRWPELFVNNPIVSFLPSSKPIPKPYREKSLKAENIVGRMTRKEKEIQTFRNFVKRLQAFDLDERIRQKYGMECFTPRVHSEVLLLNWLWQSFGETGLDPTGKKAIHPSAFFNGWMYIGSSKPTCRLCHYYFEERKSGVEHRDSHMNLYPVWAFPEVLPSQGQDAVLDRQIMLDRVLLRVRKDAFDVVRKKVSPHHKAEDSNTFSEVVTLDDRWTILSHNSNIDVDEITSMMGEMHTEDRYDDDDDNGGARL